MTDSKAEQIVPLTALFSGILSLTVACFRALDLIFFSGDAFGKSLLIIQFDIPLSFLFGLYVFSPIAYSVGAIWLSARNPAGKRRPDQIIQAVMLLMGALYLTRAVYKSDPMGLVVLPILFAIAAALLISTTSGIRRLCRYLGNYSSKKQISSSVGSTEHNVITFSRAPRSGQNLSERFLARLIDSILATICVQIPAILALKSLGMNIFTASWIPMSLSYLLSIVSEYIFLKNYQATPGKMVMGIKVEFLRQPENQDMVWNRCWRVFVFGYAMGIPILSYVAQAAAGHYIYTKGHAPWDRKCNTKVVFK